MKGLKSIYVYMHTSISLCHYVHIYLYISLHACIYIGAPIEVSAGLVGLAITYALRLTDTLNQVNRESADRETQMVSVERVQNYVTNVKQESAPHLHLYLIYRYMYRVWNICSYIWHSPGHPHPPPRGWSWFPAPPPVGVGGVVVDGWECWLMES